MRSTFIVSVALALAFACVASAAVSAAEIAALNTFYKYALGPSWHNNNGWATDTDPCTWYGVKCVEGKLTGLYLSSNNLRGRIHPAIGELVNLESIDFGCNGLSGEVPTDIQNLSKLSGFSLRENNLSGSLNVNGLKNLKWVHLDFNNFQGYLTPLYASADSLLVLGLANNSLSGPVPNFLLNGKSITTVSLANNFLKVNMTDVKISPTLQALDLTNNYLYGRLLPNIFTSKMALQEVLLAKASISGAIPTTLSLATNMVVLDLSHNFFTGSIPNTFGEMPHLLSLRLLNNSLSGTIPTSFSTQRIMDVDFSLNAFDCPIPSWAAYTKATCVQKWKPFKIVH